MPKVKATKRHTPVSERILAVLRRYPGKAFTSKQLKQHIGGNPTDNWIRKELKELVDGGHIHRKPSVGHSYLYSYSKNHQAYQANPIEPEIVIQKEVPRVQVTPEQVRLLLKGWSERRWDPKIFRSAKFLPLSIGRLFELAHELSYGGQVKQSDLNDIFTNLESFKKDLTSTFTTLVSLMETEELWDANKFFKYLMEGAPPVDLLRDQSVQLKENYK